MEAVPMHFIEAIDGNETGGDTREITSATELSWNEIREDKERRLINQISA